MPEISLYAYKIENAPTPRKMHPLQEKCTHLNNLTIKSLNRIKDSVRKDIKTWNLIQLNEIDAPEIAVFTAVLSNKNKFDFFGFTVRSV